VRGSSVLFFSKELQVMFAPI